MFEVRSAIGGHQGQAMGCLLKIHERVKMPAHLAEIVYDLVRKDHAFADQDRAPYALGAGRDMDEVRCLRCGAVPRGTRTESTCVSEVLTPHARRCTRAVGALSRS